jgi:hypothetical protein
LAAPKGFPLYPLRGPASGGQTWRALKSMKYITVNKLSGRKTKTVRGFTRITLIFRSKTFLIPEKSVKICGQNFLTC